MEARPTTGRRQGRSPARVSGARVVEKRGPGRLPLAPRRRPLRVPSRGGGGGGGVSMAVTVRRRITSASSSSSSSDGALISTTPARALLLAAARIPHTRRKMSALRCSAGRCLECKRALGWNKHDKTRHPAATAKQCQIPPFTLRQFYASKLRFGCEARRGKPRPDFVRPEIFKTAEISTPPFASIRKTPAASGFEPMSLGSASPCLRLRHFFHYFVTATEAGCR